jgi:hypothetical protein
MQILFYFLYGCFGLMGVYFVTTSLMGRFSLAGLPELPSKILLLAGGDGGVDPVPGLFGWREAAAVGRRCGAGDPGGCLLPGTTGAGGGPVSLVEGTKQSMTWYKCYTDAFSIRRREKS